MLLEITPLADQDCFFIVERIKSEFSFPLHTHKEFELNYIENGAHARRTVGDSIEEIGEYDLVLITNDQLQHTWHTGACTSHEIREITIHFPPDLFSEKILYKNQFQSIKRMFELGRKGVTFPQDFIRCVKPMLDSLVNESHKFYSVINLIVLLYELSTCKDIRTLASTSFAQSELNIESRRIKKVIDFLQMNYAKKVKLNDVASLINMSPEGFSRFFRMSTGKSFTEFVTDFRLGCITRLLIDTTKTISEICYECGFNNLSNFNRIFRKNKFCSPTEFRETYGKNQLII